MAELNTHGYRMVAGKHAGELITRVPVSYLKWMVNIRHREAAYAAAELARRGTVTPNVEISGHAIDRASQRCLHLWRQCDRPDEGLHAWLVRMAEEALAMHAQLKAPPNDVIIYGGMRLVFERDGVWPILKTVQLA